MGNLSEHLCSAEEDSSFATSDSPFAPMVVIGKINDEGLGPVSWWNDEDSDESGESSDDNLDAQEDG